MKRMLRRTIGAVLGLTIGWWAAGLMPGAAEAGLTNDANGKPHVHHDDCVHFEGWTSAHRLVPEPGHAAWASTYVLGAVGLFAAAVVIGVPALKLRGPEPEDPADHHDDHGHH